MVSSNMRLLLVGGRGLVICLTARSKMMGGRGGLDGGGLDFSSQEAPGAVMGIVWTHADVFGDGVCDGTRWEPHTFLSVRAARRGDGKSGGALCCRKRAAVRAGACAVGLNEVGPG